MDQELQIAHQDHFLSGVFHFSQSEHPRGTLIMSHGFRGSKDGGGRAKALAEQASRQFNVIRYDFTPLGSLTQQQAELSTVINYVKNYYPGKINLLGRSMGGCASLLAADSQPEIAGLILWSMPFDLRDTFLLSLGQENIEKLERRESVPLNDEWGQASLVPEFYQDLLTHDLQSALGRLSSKKVLFINGEVDEIVPVKQAQKAYELCSGQKEFVLIRDGDHRFLSGFSQAKEAVLNWLYANY